MYSMVMVMAMSGSAALPASCFGSCHGSSCHGAVACSCSGYSSCSGSCHGSSCHGSKSFSLFNKHSSCHGSCSGYSICSGYSSCSGSVSCHGSSCSGSCHGSSCHGGGLFSKFKHNSCHGSSCHGYSSCSGSCTGCTGAAPAASQPLPTEPKKAEGAKPPAASLATPAKVFVSLPADATLTIDGHATTSTSAQRTFVSPTLEAGKDYQYTLKAEMVRDGKAVTEIKTVVVRAGETTEVSFDTLTVASN